MKSTMAGQGTNARRDTGIARRARRSLGAALLAMFALNVQPLAAQALPLPDASAPVAARPDSVTTTKQDVVIPNRALFHRSDLYVAGSFVAGTMLLLPFDRQLTDAFRAEYRRDNSALHSVANAGTWAGGPGPLMIGSAMFVVGRVGHVPKMAEIALHGTEAVVAGTLVANLVKGVVGRARPYATLDTNPHDFDFGRGFSNRDYKAFPSGHTASAFAAAAAVVSETREWWPGSTKYVAPVMYGGATLVGLSRIYNDQHWASDVVVGAAVGTFAGLKVVRFNHTHAGNMLDRILLGATLAPTPNGTAVSLHRTF